MFSALLAERDVLLLFLGSWFGLFVFFFRRRLQTPPFLSLLLIWCTDRDAIRGPFAIFIVP